MNISVRTEGGAGDVLLACRFIPEIKRLNPDSDITLYIDSEGKTFQKEVVEYLYPSLFKEVKIIPNKKYGEFYISSQFGEENQRGFIENVPDVIYNEMLSYSKFYELHIDSLTWLNYGFNLNKCFDKLSSPELSVSQDKIIISNLISTTGTEHIIKEKWWLEDLILKIDDFCHKNNLKHYILCTNDINSQYENFINKTSNTEIFNGSIKEVIDLISRCDGFIGIDSAWRLVSHAFEKATITISKNCRNRGEVPISHQLRWLIQPKTTFGLYNPIDEIITLFSKMLENSMYSVFPELAFIDNIDNFIIKRNYSVIKEKCILNE